MKTFGKTGFLASLVLAVCGLQTADAQSIFNKYGPVAGIQKNDGTTYQDTAAASSDVIALFTACSGVQYLGADGACHTYGGGTVTSVSLTVPSGLTVTGSPVTTSGTLAITTTLNGVLRGTGSGFTTALSSNIVSLWTGTCDATTFLRGDGACSNPTSVPGGSTTQVQYNNAGAFAGSADFTWTNGSRTLNIGSTGSAVIEPVVNAAGTGRALTIRSGGTSLSGSQGGGLDIRAGASSGAGNGATFNLTGAAGGSTGQGGPIILNGGGGGSTSGAAGSIQVNGGTPTDGNGGSVQILGSDGVGTNRNGGSVNIFAGANTGSGTLGTINFLGGNGVLAGTPTGGAKGVGTINAAGLYVNGVSVSTGGTVTNVASGTGITGGPITTTGTLSVDQTANLTWTGNEAFTTQTFFQSASTAFNPIGMCANGLTATNRCFAFRIGSSGDLQLAAADDTGVPSGHNGLDIARTAGAVTAVTVGNTTDNPVVNIPGGFVASGARPALNTANSGVYGGGTTGGITQLAFIDSAAGVDQKIWDIVVDTNSFTIRAVNDANSSSVSAFTIARTGTTINNITGNGGKSMFPDSGSWTSTLSGVTAVVTGTLNYSRMGGLACIYATADITGTSNVNTMTLSGVPAIVQPGTSRVVAVGNMQDNGVGNQIVGQATVSGSTITLAKLNATPQASSSNWTTSGTKGINAGWSMCYSVL